jgi:hypothetical protein
LIGLIHSQTGETGAGLRRVGYAARSQADGTHEQGTVDQESNRPSGCGWAVVDVDPAIAAVSIFQSYWDKLADKEAVCRVIRVELFVSIKTRQEFRIIGEFEDGALDAGRVRCIDAYGRIFGCVLQLSTDCAFADGHHALNIVRDLERSALGVEGSIDEESRFQHGVPEFRLLQFGKKFSQILETVLFEVSI